MGEPLDLASMKVGDSFWIKCAPGEKSIRRQIRNHNVAHYTDIRWEVERRNKDYGFRVYRLPED
jgi:hypothetical protein